MPAPNRDEWRRRWERPVLQRLGVSGEDVERGYARMAVARPPGADDLLLQSAVNVAADLAAISAVFAQIDDGRERPNGTAELHLSFVAPLPDTLAVTARVAHWADYAAHVELEARGSGGELVARGLTTYSLRPVVADG